MTDDAPIPETPLRAWWERWGGVAFGGAALLLIGVDLARLLGLVGEVRGGHLREAVLVALVLIFDGWMLLGRADRFWVRTLEPFWGRFVPRGAWCWRALALAATAAAGWYLFR